MRPWSSQHHSSWVWWMWRKASVTWVAHVFLKRKVLGGLSVLWLPGNQVDHPATSTCCNHVGYRLWDVVRYIVYIIRLLRSGTYFPVKHGSPSGISRRIVSWSLREMMQGMFDQVRWVAAWCQCAMLENEENHVWFIHRLLTTCSHLPHMEYFLFCI